MPGHNPESAASGYQREWVDFRKHRNRILLYLVFEFLGFMPIVGLAAMIDRSFTFPAGLVWGAVYLFTVSRLRNFPCPRCGKNFFGGFFGTAENFRALECANCGLPRCAGQ